MKTDMDFQVQHTVLIGLLCVGQSYSIQFRMPARAMRIGVKTLPGQEDESTAWITSAVTTTNKAAFHWDLRAVLSTVDLG